MSKGKYIFHSINSIRSRPDDNPQSKNRMISDQAFTEAKGVGRLESSASTSTQYRNRPCILYLASLHLPVAHPPVRRGGFRDLLKNFTAISDYRTQAPAALFTLQSHDFSYLVHPALGNSPEHTPSNSPTCLVTDINHRAKWSLPTTRSISSSSATGTSELKQLRKSCCSQQL